MSKAERPARLENGRQDLIMDTAIDCFARYGYHSTSIDRIAKASGVTKGALYYHFRDKEDLLFEAVRNRVGQFERHVAGDLMPAREPIEALRRLTRLCIDHATKSNHRRFIVTLMVEALETNARLSGEFREMMNRFRGFLRGIVRAGQEQGVFRAEVNPRTAAAVYSGAVMGAEVQYYQDPASVDLDETLHAFLGQFIEWLEPRRGASRARR